MVPDVPSRSLREPNQGSARCGTTEFLPLQDPKGIALGCVRLVMQWSTQRSSQSPGSPTQPLPAIPWCIHPLSGFSSISVMLSQTWCISESNRSSYRRHSGALICVFLPVLPKFSSFSAQHWWHGSGLESRAQPGFRKHYKSICSNIYSGIFSCYTYHGLLAYWEHSALGKGKPQSLYCCQAKCH